MLMSVKRDKLVEKRKTQNLSQYRLSILSGLSGNAIYRMENEEHRVSPLRAKAVADALRCDLGELFYSSQQERSC